MISYSAVHQLINTTTTFPVEDTVGPQEIPDSQNTTDTEQETSSNTPTTPELPLSNPRYPQRQRTAPDRFTPIFD